MVDVVSGTTARNKRTGEITRSAICPARMGAGQVGPCGPALHAHVHACVPCFASATGCTPHPRALPYAAACFGGGCQPSGPVHPRRRMRTQCACVVSARLGCSSTVRQCQSLHERVCKG